MAKNANAKKKKNGVYILIGSRNDVLSFCEYTPAWNVCQALFNVYFSLYCLLLPLHNYAHARTHMFVTLDNFPRLFFPLLSFIFASSSLSISLYLKCLRISSSFYFDRNTPQLKQIICFNCCAYTFWQLHSGEPKKNQNKRHWYQTIVLDECKHTNTCKKATVCDESHGQFEPFRFRLSNSEESTQQ